VSRAFCSPHPRREPLYLRLMILQSSIFDGWHSIQTDRATAAAAAADLLVHRCIYEIIDLITCTS